MSEQMPMIVPAGGTTRWPPEELPLSPERTAVLLPKYGSLLADLARLAELEHPEGEPSFAGPIAMEEGDDAR